MLWDLGQGNSRSTLPGAVQKQLSGNANGAWRLEGLET
jgi:hypothetical protein